MLEIIIAIISIAAIFFTLGIIIILGNIIMNYYTGVPYAPTPKKIIDEVIRALEIQQGEKVCDLGFGDGRLLFEAEKKGALCAGFEISPFSFIRTWIKKIIKKSHVRLYFKNFYHEDISQFDIIFCFLVGSVMARVQKKLKHEAKKGAIVVSYGFSLPNWTPEKTITSNNPQNKIYFYKIH